MTAPFIWGLSRLRIVLVSAVASLIAVLRCLHDSRMLVNSTSLWKGSIAVLTGCLTELFCDVRNDRAKDKSTASMLEKILLQSKH